MPIEMISDYDKAFELGKEYIDASHHSARVHDSYKPDIPTTALPIETSSARWNLTLTALKNTLTYIFEKLHHPCYMLCVSDNRFKIVKLVMKDASPTFVDAIRKHHIPQLEKNKTITHDQRQNITQKLRKMMQDDNIRIMQCIVKEQKLESSNYDMIREYMNLLSEMKLPNGVFILNLTDAVILKNDGKEPFPMVTGDAKLGNYNFSYYIPILGMSGQKGYRDIPIPNYDDVEIAMSDKKKKEMSEFTTLWKNKSIQKAVFRGGPTGCGYTAETNMRIKLAGMKSNYLDVGITGNSFSKSVNSKSIKFDPTYGLGMMNVNLKPVPRLTMAQQSKYKYIIHVDGNVNAYRLLTTMCTGSLIIRVSSEYRSWVDHLIQAGVHYVPVKPDLSNLDSCIRWCIKHDEKCEKIAAAGREFATSVLQKEFMKNYFQNIFWVFSKHHSNTNVKSLTPASPNFPPPNKLETYDEILQMQWKVPPSATPPLSSPKTPLVLSHHKQRKLSTLSTPSSPSISPPITPDITPPPTTRKTRKIGGYVIPTTYTYNSMNKTKSQSKTKKSVQFNLTGSE